MLFTASAAITAYAVNGNTPSAASMPDTPDMMSIGSLMPDDDMMHQGILLDGDSLKQAGLESKIQKAVEPVTLRPTAHIGPHRLPKSNEFIEIGLMVLVTRRAGYPNIYAATKLW